jgi:Spy/CpxP family protein refolding chaperone
LSDEVKQWRGVFCPSVKEVVMKRLLAVVTLVVGMAVYANCTTLAQEKPARPAAAGLAERIQDLNLTDEQEAKIAEITKECKPKVMEAAKQLATISKEEVEKVRALLTPEQKTRLETLKEERHERRPQGLAERIAHFEDLDLTDGEIAKIAEIRKECRPMIVKAMQGLTGTLTDEQKKLREDELLAGKPRRQFIASLNLTPAQKEKVEAVGKELRGLVHQELEKMKGVLAEGQQEKLQDFKEERQDRVRDRMAHRIANLKDLNLTDAQKSQMAEIRKEFRPKVHEAGNKLRGAIREEVESIAAVLKG